MFARVEVYIYYVFLGAASVCQGQNDMLNPEVNTTSNAAAPRHNAIGAPITSNTKNVTNKIVPIILPCPHFLLLPLLPEQNLP